MDSAHIENLMIDVFIKKNKARPERSNNARHTYK